VKTTLEIIGGKTPRTKLLADNVRVAVESLDARVEIVAITDPVEIERRGITETPALALNGKTLVQGRVPSVQQIASWISPER
jgi:hypothetical protein